MAKLMLELHYHVCNVTQFSVISALGIRATYKCSEKGADKQWPSLLTERSLVAMVTGQGIT